MLKNLIAERLRLLNQEALLLGLESLGPKQQEAFFQELQKWDLKTLQSQRNTLFGQEQMEELSPKVPYAISGENDDAALGNQEILDGKVGCLILAGGQASRLKSPLPKALIPILPASGKTLLEILCGKRSDPSHPIAVMTSSFNHGAISSFIKEKEIGGIDLFEQETLPFLDDAGNWLLEEPGKIAKGPNGNGEALKRFFDSGLWSKWKERGVRYLVVIPIDNPLADPFDAELVGALVRSNADAAMRCVFRHDKEEKVGVVGLSQEGRICVREYSELPLAHDLFDIAHIGIYCFSFPFIEKAAAEAMPLHLARKTAPILFKTANGIFKENGAIWKCETFLFDVLLHSRRTEIVVSSRDKSYAPLKNASGDKSLETVQKALLSLGYE